MIFSLSKNLFLSATLFGAVCVSTMALAAPDNRPDSQVYEDTVDRAANNCENYSGVKAKPDIYKIPITALRVATQRNVLICPNTKISAKGPAVIWYGNHKAMVWNPDVSGAADVMNTQLTLMAQNDSYPSDIITWDASGKELKGQLVPTFTVTCASSSVQDCLFR